MKDRLSRRQRDGVGVVSEAVEECSGAGGNRVDNFLAGDDSAERSVSAGETLGSNQDVGLHIPMLHAKVPTCPAHPRHNLVGNEEHSVAATDFDD